MKKSALIFLFSSISLVTWVTDSSLACDISSISSMGSRDSFNLDDGVDWQAKFRELESWWQNAPKQPLVIPEWQIRAAEQEREDKRRRQEMLDAKLRSNANDARFQQQSDDLLSEVRERDGKTGQFTAFNSRNIHKLKKEKSRKQQQYVPDYATYQRAQQALGGKDLGKNQRTRYKKIIEDYDKFWQEVELACETSSDDDFIYKADSETERANAEFAEFVWQYENGEYSSNLNEIGKADSKEVFSEAAAQARIRANKKALKDLSQAAQEAATKRLQQKERLVSVLADLLYKTAEDEKLRAAKQVCEEMLKGKRIAIKQKENMLLVLQELLASQEFCQEPRQEEAETDESSFRHEYSTSNNTEESGNKFTANVNTEDIRIDSEYITEPDIDQLSALGNAESYGSNLPDLMAIKQNTELLFENSLLHNMMISHRLLLLSSPAAGEEESTYGFWFDGIVSKARQRPIAHRGYNASGRNITIGVDGESLSGHLLGFAVSLGNSKLNIDSSSNYYKTSGFSGAFYHHMPVSCQGIGDIELASRFFASYSRLNTLSFNGNGKMFSYAAGARTSAAKNISLYQGKKVQLYLTPSLHAGYDFLRAGRFQENGDDGYHAQVAPNSVHRLQSSIGAKIQGNIAANCGNNIRPEISLQLTKYHYNRPLSIKGFVEYQGERVEQVVKGIGPEQKTSLAIGGGVMFGMGDSSFGAYYNCNIAKGYLAHQASLRLKVEI